MADLVLVNRSQSPFSGRSDSDCNCDTPLQESLMCHKALLAGGLIQTPSMP